MTNFNETEKKKINRQTEKYIFHQKKKKPDNSKAALTR